MREASSSELPPSGIHRNEWALAVGVQNAAANQLQRITRLGWIALAIAATTGFTATTSAQSLPKASREAFRCEVNGKVVYTDQPCLGAKKVDTEPTRGMNMNSGRVMVGKDVQQEIYREQMATALKPLTGMDKKQYALHHKRFQLPASAKFECQRLDQSIPEAEINERSAQKSGDRTNLLRVQQDLLQQRQRFVKLGC